VIRGNPSPSLGPQGLQQAFIEERKDYLTMNQGHSQEFVTRTPTNNDSNHPLFRLPHLSWVLDMSSTGPRP